MKKSKKNDRKHVNILGINVISTSRQELLTAIDGNITHNVKTVVTTPNPELVLMSQSNKKLKEALNTSTFAIPDGIGLAQAAKFLSFKTPKNILVKVVTTFYQGVLVGLATFFNKKYLSDSLEIIKGRELFLDLVRLSEKRGWKIFLLGGEGPEAAFSASKLTNKYKKLKVEHFSGPIIDNQAKPISKKDEELYREAVDRINEFKPDLLFLAFRNPKTEIFAMDNYKKLNTKVVLALGGTLRYFSGMRSLPPKFLDDLGLEWVWRLISEPRRIKRILNAFPVFPIKVWMYKLQQS